MYLVRFCHKPP